jgi:putative transposase
LTIRHALSYASRMARKLRIQFPGATYLVTSRGDRREPIFHSDADRQAFLELLGETCAKTQWRVHAVCLLEDHFHLALETPEPNLVVGMKWLLGTYTARFNRQHKLCGHLFAGRYKSMVVGDGFLGRVCDYVHLNPARANLINPDIPLADYPWSSYPMILASAQARPNWVRPDRLFKELGIPTDDPAGRRRFAERLEQKRTEDLSAELRSIRRGWCLGPEPFRRSMLGEISKLAGPNHFGRELNEAAEDKARRIIDEELQAMLWTEAELLRRRKGDPKKIAIANRLRNETTVTLQWIAAHLHMGTKTHLSHLLYWNRRGELPAAAQLKAGPSRAARSVVSRKASLTSPQAPTPEPVAESSLLVSDPFHFDPIFD